MANIDIKRGEKTTIEVTYTLAGESTGLDLGDSSGGAYSGSLTIRKKRGDSYKGGVLDVLTTGNSRMTFRSPTNSEPHNITLTWTQAQCEAFPNETATIAGDLEITRNSNVEHSLRLLFDVTAEILGT